MVGEVSVTVIEVGVSDGADVRVSADEVASASSVVVGSLGEASSPLVSTASVLQHKLLDRHCIRETSNRIYT